MREEISTKTAARKERVTERQHDCNGTKQSRGSSAQSGNLPGEKQNEANRFHTLATHTKPNRNKAAHSSLSLPHSWIKARLTLMRESRVCGGKKRHEGGENYRERSTQRDCGACRSLKTCAWRRSVFFSPQEKNAFSSDQAERGQWLRVQSFREVLSLFHTH